MPRLPRRALAAIFSTAVGLAFIFSFKTPDGPPVPLSNPRTPTATTRPPSSGTRGSIPTPRPSGPGTGGSSTTALRDGTVVGPEIEMRFGPVQVQVTIAGGRITDVTPLALPTGGRSGRISSYAAPTLRSEALNAQSAAIDIVSGATYTSAAYSQSLQSALDQAHG